MEAADEDEARPSGLPAAESRAQRVSEPDPEAEEAEVGPSEDSPTEEGKPISLRPPRKDPSEVGSRQRTLPPPGLGLGPSTTSARLRLQLALDEDDEGASLPPPGLPRMTPSARLRLELALDDDEEPIEAPVLPRERVSSVDLGAIPFDAEGRKVVTSLVRWITLCGLLTLSVSALTGLSYFTGEGSVAHVVIGILAFAVSFWLLMAAWSFRKVVTARQHQHHLVHAFGHVRSALLLKAILVFAAMVLGCFTFSVAGSLLFLLG